jgi:Tfp pilus assembly pilus retraction ATPase PilT
MPESHENSAGVIDSFKKYLEQANLIHSVSDIYFQPNRQVAVKINRRWRPHPFVEDILSEDEFNVLLRQCLELDAEYPLGPLLSKQGPLTPDEEKRLSEKRDFAFYAKLDDIQYRVRGHIDNDYNGSFMDLRVLRADVTVPEVLGFPQGIADSLLERNRGLILVAGRMGSGKSTTLSALGKAYSEKYPGSRILTIEDPIEYVLSFPTAVVSQKQVGVHVASYTEGIYHAKREQPDLLIVGEMRDEATIRATLEAASSGILVITTLHSDRYDRALNKIIDAYSPEKHEIIGRQLAYSLRGVIVQQLISSVEPDGDDVFALPSLGYDIFLNDDSKTQAPIRKLEWDKLAVEESVSTVTLRSRVDDLMKEGAISEEEGRAVMEQYAA